MPVEQTRLFTTTVDNQKYVRIEVCQGESASFDENTKLGEVLLSGIRPAPRGEISVSVTFEINTDGLLEVRALDGQTGQEQTATMKVLGGMSPEDVDAMISKAESEGLLEEDGRLDGAVEELEDESVPRPVEAEGAQRSRRAEPQVIAQYRLHGRLKQRAELRSELGRDVLEVVPHVFVARGQV